LGDAAVVGAVAGDGDGARDGAAAAIAAATVKSPTEHHGSMDLLSLLLCDGIRIAVPVGDQRKELFAL